MGFLLNRSHSCDLKREEWAWHIQSSPDQTAAALLAAIVESSDDAILSMNLQGIILSWNGAARRLYGYTADEVIGKPVTILIPNDRLDEEITILARLGAGERVDHFETIRCSKDGTLLDISLTISPIHNGAGAVVGASKIARDIGERKRFEQQQSLLLEEMHHRVKNLFSLAGALVSLSAKSATSVDDFATSIRDRLMALSRAHELTLPILVKGGELERSISFATLLVALTCPYLADDGNRVVLVGDDFDIGGRSLTNVALLFHEFVTNSAKYGALAERNGKIEVACIRDSGGLNIRWVEAGGLKVVEPTGRTGFGSQLERSLTVSLGCSIAREWRPEGLIIEVTLQPDALEA